MLTPEKEKKGKKDLVFNKLHELITNGYFRPGESLSERDIADMLGVSRTPVRDAFNKLEKEGLVISTPKKGMTIPTYTAEQVKDIYNIREYLEGLAASTIAEKNDPTIVEMLKVNIEKAKAAASENDIKKQVIINGEFHQIIVDSTRNLELIHIYNTLRAKISLMRSTSLSTQGRINTNLEEHIKICDAIASADIQLAEKQARLHVISSKEFALSTFNFQNESKIKL